MIQEEKSYWCIKCGWHSKNDSDFEAVIQEGADVLKCPRCKIVDPEISEEEFSFVDYCIRLQLNRV